MKSMNTLAIAAALALTGAGFASATPTIYHVSGSTAFRVADVSAEVNYLINNHSGATAAYNGSSLTGASYSVIQSGDGSITFENYFNGSILGDESVSAVTGVASNQNEISFPTATGVTFSACTLATPSTPAGGGTAITAVTSPAGSSGFPNVETTYADIAFSDVSFATAQKVIKLATSTAATASSGGSVGIVPFVFVANATADITNWGSTTVATNTLSTGTITSATTTVTVNVTPQNFSDLYTGGEVAGSIFTGTSTDAGVTVYALGRDIDSGTRATALAETGFGLKGSGANAVTGAVTQLYPLDGSGNVVGNVGTNEIESFEEVPASSVDGISLNAGDGGYASGGNLAKAMSVTIDDNATTGNPKTVLVAYLGVSDAYTALTTSPVTGRQPALLLGYNGSTFNPAGSTTQNNFATAGDIQKIYYGQYTYWSYEQVYYNTNNSGKNANDSANPQSVVTSLTGELKTDGLDVLSSAGVVQSSMKVSRTNDGLQVD